MQGFCCCFCLLLVFWLLRVLLHGLICLLFCTPLVRTTSSVLSSNTGLQVLCLWRALICRLFHTGMLRMGGTTVFRAGSHRTLPCKSQFVVSE